MAKISFDSYSPIKESFKNCARDCSGKPAAHGFRGEDLERKARPGAHYDQHVWLVFFQLFMNTTWNRYTS